MPRRFSLVCLLALAMFAFSACQGEQTPTQPPLATFLLPKALQSTVCQFAAPVDDDDITCYTLEVPADYRQVQGEQIELEVVVVKSRGDDPQPDPVIVLPFDADFNFLQYTPFFIDMFSPILEQRDIILYQNRSLSAGEDADDLSCAEVDAVFIQSLQQAERGQDFIDQTLEAHNTCRRRLFDQDVDLDVYTLDQHASDVVALGLALNQRQVNIFGFGSGASIGPRVLQNHPEAVRSAVFSAIFPPVTAADLENGYYQALTRLFEACRFDEDCNQAYPDLEEGFLFDVEMLDTNPLVLDVLNPLNPGMMKVYLDGEAFILLFRDLMTSTETLIKLPQIIDNVRRGQGYKLAEDMQQAISFYSFGTQGTTFFNDCTENWNAISMAPLSNADIYSPVREALQSNIDLAARVCATWFQSDFAPPEVKPFYSTVPTLVFHGSYDPFISQDLLEAWMGNMKNATVVIGPNTSRSFFSDRNCDIEVAAAYYDDPEKKPDATCAEEKRLDFILPQR